jgi:hypothetical protein
MREIAGCDFRWHRRLDRKSLRVDFVRRFPPSALEDCLATLGCWADPFADLSMLLNTSIGPIHPKSKQASYRVP